MKQYLIYGIFFVLSNYAIGQNLDREKCFQEFRASQSNAKQYQMNGSLYVSPFDSTQTPVVDSIYFFEAYCRGFEDALNYEYLCYRWSTQANFIPSCTYYSYQKWGVKIECTGDIIYDQAILFENAGFNHLMNQRIKEKLGNNYSELGKENAKWISLDLKSLNEILKCVRYELITDSTALFRLDSNLVNQCQFDYFEGFSIVDTLSQENREYNFSELKEGAIMTVSDSEEKFIAIKFEFRDYDDVVFCRAGWEWHALFSKVHELDL